MKRWRPAVRPLVEWYKTGAALCTRPQGQDGMQCKIQTLRAPRGRPPAPRRERAPVLAMEGPVTRDRSSAVHRTAPSSRHGRHNWHSGGHQGPPRTALVAAQGRHHSAHCHTLRRPASPRRLALQRHAQRAGHAAGAPKHPGPHWRRRRHHHPAERPEAEERRPRGNPSGHRWRPCLGPRRGPRR